MGYSGRPWRLNLPPLTLLYMSETYGISLSQDERAMFEEWHEADPVDAWEQTRDERIEAIQGNRNEWLIPL